MPPQQEATFGERNGGVQILNNHGTISVVDEGRNQPPQLYHNIPVRRNGKGFIDRPELMLQINDFCTGPFRAALTGLAGMGKSELAIELAYRAHDAASQESRVLRVFWIYANSRKRFLQQVRLIAGVIKLSLEHSADIPQLVKEWLRDEVNGPWFLVLDGVDAGCDFSHGDSGASQEDWEDDLRAFLPDTDHGSILITTRHEGTARDLGVEEEHVVKVDSMTSTQAMELLQKQNKISTQFTVNGEALVEALDSVPYAIIQAAAYIRMRRMSAQQLLEELRSSKRETISVLKQVVSRPNEPSPISLVKIWQRSFGLISRKRSSAADMMSVMAFFDCGDILQSLLELLKGLHTRRQLEEDEARCAASEENLAVPEWISDSQDENSIAKLDYDQDRQLLLEHHLIFECEGKTAFTIHHLVQLVLRDWLEVSGETDRFNSEFVYRLNHAFPEGKFENWPTCERLYKHVKAAIHLPPVDNEAIQWWASLLYKASVYAFKTSKYSEAETLAQKSYESRRSVLGATHPLTAESILIRGKISHHQGRWRASERLFKRAVHILEHQYGSDHGNTLTAKSELASAYREQAQWDTAQEIEEKVLEKRQESLGSSHLDTLTSMSNLASTYWCQGHTTKAEDLDVEVWERRTAILGAAHPDTLSSKVHLALSYGPERRQEALKMLQEVLSKSTTVLGPTHSDTLIAKIHVATTYRDLSQLEKADELIFEVHKDSEGVLGLLHPFTLNAMAERVTTWVYQDRWQEAVELGTKVVEARKDILPPAHPDTLLSMENLATAYFNKGDLMNAAELEVEVLELCRKHCARTPLRIANSLQTLAETRHAQGYLADAIRLGEECLQLRSADMNRDGLGVSSFREMLAQWRCE